MADYVQTDCSQYWSAVLTRAMFENTLNNKIRLTATLELITGCWACKNVQYRLGDEFVLINTNIAAPNMTMTVPADDIYLYIFEFCLIMVVTPK